MDVAISRGAGLPSLSRGCQTYKSVGISRNNSAPEGSSDGRSNHGGHEDKRSNEVCAHCVSQNYGMGLRDRRGLVGTLTGRLR
jgi:hypothetical protein